MRIWILAAFALSGCLDSFVSGHCDDGFVTCGSACVPAGTCTTQAPPPDAPPAIAAPDAPPAAEAPDAAPVCPIGLATCTTGCADLVGDVDNCGSCGTACGAELACSNGTCCGAAELGCRGACIDPLTHPDNCGACGIPCASGICQAGVCAGAPVGHLVLIGHDYQSTRAGMNRLVGNAVFLARVPEVTVATYAVGATPSGVIGANAAIDQVAREIGRSWRRVPVDAAAVPGALAGADAFVIYAETTLAPAELDALAAAWRAPIATFLAKGGIVIVLEGAAAETHRLVGDRFACTGRSIATGSALTVSAPRDAMAAAVPTTYWAEVDTVAFTGTTGGAVVTDAAGDAVVVHQTF